MPADQVTAPGLPRSYPTVDPAPDNERVVPRPPDLARDPSTQFGVAFRLLAAFAALTVFAAATSIFALYAFDRYRIGFDELASKNLPVLSAASELAQRSEKLSANAPALAAVESHFARQAVSGELKTQVESLSRVSDYLERLSSEISSLADLKRAKRFRMLGAIRFNI
jgi:phosphoglycerate-specific signal transduction histidine kinase